jgi:hypothetical protein
MFKMSEPDLAKKPAVYRYVYFLVSSLKPMGFRAWKARGEPNPFVGKSYRRVVTERVEFVDIFGDDLKRSKPTSRDCI